MGCYDFGVKRMNNINELMKHLRMGYVLAEPVPVYGGLLHKMYRVTTSKGVFAVKILNPEIMKRPEALQNTILSEKIAGALAKDISLVAAVELAGKQVHEWLGKYYMFFPWLEGVSVFPPDITPKHCETVGTLLGKIHSQNVSVEGVKQEADVGMMYPWKEYLTLAEMKKLGQREWFEVYQSALADVIQLNKSACEARKALANKQVISHRDLDPKNVMWQGEVPFVIDWEAAGYVNPYQELLEVINYWADDGKGRLQKGHLEALLLAYEKYVNLQNVDWEPVFAGSFSGMLGWLAYNVKRALGMEVSGEEDVRAGEEQVVGTIVELRAYQKKLEMVKKYLLLGKESE